MEKIIITIILINIEITINKHDYSFTLKKKCLLRHQNSTLNITFRKTTSNKLVDLLISRRYLSMSPGAGGIWSGIVKSVLNGRLSCGGGWSWRSCTFLGLLLRQYFVVDHFMAELQVVKQICRVALGCRHDGVTHFANNFFLLYVRRFEAKMSPNDRTCPTFLFN